MNEPPLISVVIPAYNAQETLEETIESVCHQSHENLEIIVVNDGSTDGTEGIARNCAARDARIQVLTKSNGGVAAARNAGIAASTGAFVALVDADDLWHAKKLELQLSALTSSGPTTGFAYTLYHHIDAESQVTGSGGEVVTGPAFLRALLMNYVGNGSSLLIRREALDAVGGYDPSLHAAGVQGCEDYLIQTLMARDWKVVCVPQYLTYYRQTAGAMSTDRVRMLRSQLKMFDIIENRYPEIPKHITAVTRSETHTRIAFKHLRSRHPGQAMVELTRALRLSPKIMLLTIWFSAMHRLRPVAKPQKRSMAEVAQAHPLPAPQPFSQRLHPLAHLYSEIEAREEAFFNKRSRSERRFEPDNQNEAGAGDA